mmetsp:Transcript_14501/g.20010  ORF Transcript_14501/g.20010 Transcript_14501/m.20010 type:complete len:282 (+) Transcript_14501:95-940(+)|eukprot:CAMPEP_0196578974 /NCGR_PEP_ID=MMETSP1081-20130531/14590_1 /TAXON_ID=36882 /ORGANISM="Pyramimonas amylifera, Strain CCMP720" /LENGTH=281 /DNA_ID=CAMNT_0041898385 /DNA_START=92 /DNA_END=937 /DNA_ORIENTATION=+
MQAVIRSTPVSISQNASVSVGASKSATVRTSPKAAPQLSARVLLGSMKSIENKRSISMKDSKSSFSVQATAPTVSDTKEKFMKAYSKPIPAIFNTVIQEMIVLQHINRYSTKYQYSPIGSLGFTSVFDQIFEVYEYGSPEEIFKAYVSALAEDPAKYRTDTDSLTEQAKACSSAAELAELPAVKALAEQGDKLLHSRFLAIGIFRLLDLAGLKEPTALAELVKASGLKQDAVNRDLLTYKGMLSKMGSAKALMQEFNAREKKKTAERLAEKEEKATKMEEA